MPIQFKCPECLHSVKAPDGTYGKPADCPACGKAITIPESVALEIKPPCTGKPPSANPNGFFAFVAIGCFILSVILVMIFLGSLPFHPPRFTSDAFTEEVRILCDIRSLLILLCALVAFYIGYRIVDDAHDK